MAGVKLCSALLIVGGGWGWGVGGVCLASAGCRPLRLSGWACAGRGWTVWVVALAFCFRALESCRDAFVCEGLASMDGMLVCRVRAGLGPQWGIFDRSRCVRARLGGGGLPGGGGAIFFSLSLAPHY